MCGVRWGAARLGRKTKPRSDLDGVKLSMRRVFFRLGEQGSGSVRRFPQPSTRKSQSPQLLHKRGLFFHCGGNGSTAECLKRNVKLLRLARRCKQSQQQPAIPEGELPGDIGSVRKRVLVARALRPPPLTRSPSGVELLALRGLRVVIPGITAGACNGETRRSQ